MSHEARVVLSMCLSVASFDDVWDSSASVWKLFCSEPIDELDSSNENHRTESTRNCVVSGPTDVIILSDWSHKAASSFTVGLYFLAIPSLSLVHVPLTVTSTALVASSRDCARTATCSLRSRRKLSPEARRGASFKVVF